jgi:biopolymer transport protein ExbD|tara:strand:- start:2126 stop:2533 length:408 start_codon:yes stop_codon:yes gene_type:complete
MRQNLERRFEQQQQQGIDLSPLLDVVFILLIFFIVTTVFVRESGVDVNKPQAVSTQELERNVIIIAITHHGEVMYDSNNIGVVGVRSTISQLIRQQSKPVVIQADKRVSTDLLVKVLDQAKIAGADHVSIATTGQ